MDEGLYLKLTAMEEHVEIFGYKKRHSNKIGLLEMEEITICAKPAELRRIADHLNLAAELMEKQDSNFDHLHLQDEWSDWDVSVPDVIVAKCKR